MSDNKKYENPANETTVSQRKLNRILLVVIVGMALIILGLAIALYISGNRGDKRTDREKPTDTVPTAATEESPTPTGAENTTATPTATPEATPTVSEAPAETPTPTPSPEATPTPGV